MKYFTCLLSILAAFGPLMALDENSNETEIRICPIHFIATSGHVTLANLDLNHEGNSIIVHPGDKIFATVHYYYDPNAVAPTSLNQIIVGYSEIGAQRCIYHQIGYLCGEGDASFILSAPDQPGIYEVRFRYAQAYTPEDAVHFWWEVDGQPDQHTTIGKIIVKDS